MNEKEWEKISILITLKYVSEISKKANFKNSEFTINIRIVVLLSQILSSNKLISKICTVSIRKYQRQTHQEKNHLMFSISSFLLLFSFLVHSLVVKYIYFVCVCCALS